MKEIHVAIGYDSRELDAFDVCEHSVVRRSSVPVAVTKLDHSSLRYFKLFNREWRIDKKGQHWDVLDNAPFSTEFSHTRFLIPELARRNKVKGWVIFCDCDFLWLDDIKNLVDSLDDSYPVMAVKFNYTPEENIKMDNKIQTTYNCKLWSSLMAFNMNHRANRKLTVDKVDTMKGLKLHQFDWLPNGPGDVGEINPKWNYVPGIMEEFSKIQPSAIHYSLGGPWMNGYTDCDFSDEWFAEKAHMDYVNSTQLHNMKCLKFHL
tara:strand:+ start:1054 stop:1839 length:786 start_codon:yes stop_codon:yes gene_type:complete